MKRKKKTDKTFFIVALVVVLLTFAVGYAMFSETLNVSGTAQTSGNFDVEFFNTSITSSSGCTPTSTISGNKNTLTIAVPDLQKPGSTATVSVTVKNTGNIAANLLSVDVTGNTDPDIKVTYPTWTTGVNLAAGATYTFSITVAWDSASTVANKNVSFTAALNYEQAA